MRAPAAAVNALNKNGYMCMSGGRERERQRGIKEETLRYIQICINRERGGGVRDIFSDEYFSYGSMDLTFIHIPMYSMYI